MSIEDSLKLAVLWEPANDGKVKCGLCSFRCVIADGKVGHCRVRQNVAGKLYSLNYDRVCATNVDPVEKKPLFHFLPGSKSFSIACPGCNFQCDFCQNWQISQVGQRGSIEGEAYSPKQIVDAAVDSGCESIAYTYTEPTIFMELCAECGVLARDEGLYNIFVSNGYMTVEAIDFAAGWLDGINIDLKSFSDDYYKNLCKARLGPVLETIKHVAANTDIWMEITTLVVPGQNDSDDELRAIADFIFNEAGADVPWHVSRFYPLYKMDHVQPTPASTLQRAYDIGKDAGLKHIYIGNLPGGSGENTHCANCGNVLIERAGYTIMGNNIVDGKCPGCEKAVAGIGM